MSPTEAAIRFTDTERKPRSSRCRSGRRAEKSPSCARASACRTRRSRRVYATGPRVARWPVPARKASSIATTHASGPVEKPVPAHRATGYAMHASASCTRDASGIPSA